MTTSQSTTETAAPKASHDAPGCRRRGEYEDGAILGSVVGTIDRGGEVRRLRTIDRKHKSPLLSATMPVDPG
jgi:hypothetical protein